MTIIGYRYAVLAAGLFAIMKEGPSEVLPAIGGIDSDVVYENSFMVNGEDYYPHDGSVAFGDAYSLIGDDLCVIVGHRARQHPEALDVVVPLPHAVVHDLWHFTTGRRRLLPHQHAHPGHPQRDDRGKLAPISRARRSSGLHPRGLRSV